MSDCEKIELFVGKRSRKVYCKDCHWWQVSFNDLHNHKLDDENHQCYFPNNIIIEDTPIRELKRKLLPFEKNKNNDCKDFSAGGLIFVD